MYRRIDDYGMASDNVHFSGLEPLKCIFNNAPHTPNLVADELQTGKKSKAS